MGCLIVETEKIYELDELTGGTLTVIENKPAHQLRNVPEAYRDVVLLTKEDVGYLLGAGEGKVRGLLNSGVLKKTMLGSSVRVKLSDFREYVASLSD